MATQSESSKVTKSSPARAKKRAPKSRSSAAKKRAVKTTRAISSAAKKTINTAARSSEKSIDTATRAATAKSPIDAMKEWGNMFPLQQFQQFPQSTPFKMESFMNNASFPQFDQFQSKMQSASNDYSTFVNKATAAAEKSRNRLAAGAEECSKTLASMMQTNMQRATEAVRALSTCKSLNEFADVQTRLFKQNFEATSSEIAKLAEQTTKCVSAAAEPINDLAATAMNQAKKSMAA